MSFGQIGRRLRVGAALLAGAVAMHAAGAQVAASPFPEDSGAALNRHLKDLADSPRSLPALLGAAKAALDLGDPQAAVTFYARAEEVAPRDGRVKAGIAAAFLAMEQPAPALRFLDEARALGLPEGVVAADRGLAHDLLGDPVAAQRDYALAMRANDNDELRRRLALSRAITGDRGGALSAIEDQVRRGSPAGRRVRAFVLALTGDASGATEAARAAMPSQAAMLQPFFQRLPTLRPADRAMAVHFGRFPGDAPPGAVPVTTSTYAALPPNVILGGRPDPNQPGLSTRSPAPSASASQAPGASGTQLALRTTPPARSPTSSGASAPASVPRINIPVTPGPGSSAGVQGPPDGAARPGPVAAVTIPSRPVTSPGAPTPGISAIELPASGPASFLQTAQSAAPTGAGSAPSGSRLAGLAGVAATIRALSDGAGETSSEAAATASATRPEPPAQAPASLPAPPVATSPSPALPVASDPAPAALAKRTEIPSPGATKPASVKPPPPRRFWVQLGGKPDETSLRTEFERLKTRAPELLGDKSAWTAPASATSSRLLVGPFKTRDDADLFVGLLSDEGVRATAWTSAAGQEIARLAAR